MKYQKRSFCIKVNCLPQHLHLLSVFEIKFSVLFFTFFFISPKKGNVSACLIACCNRTRAATAVDRDYV